MLYNGSSTTFTTAFTNASAATSNAADLEVAAVKIGPNNYNDLLAIIDLLTNYTSVTATINPLDNAGGGLGELTPTIINSLTSAHDSGSATGDQLTINFGTILNSNLSAINTLRGKLQVAPTGIITDMTDAQISSFAGQSGDSFITTSGAVDIDNAVTLVGKTASSINFGGVDGTYSEFTSNNAKITTIQTRDSAFTANITDNVTVAQATTVNAINNVQQLLQNLQYWS